MNNFWEIVKFEYRKLFGRKMVWLTLGVCIAVIVAACCGSMFGDCIVDGRYYDSNYNVLKKDIENARALSGRALDDELIGEAQNAYEKAEPSDMISYMNDARPYIETGLLIIYPMKQLRMRSSFIQRGKSFLRFSGEEKI